MPSVVKKRKATKKKKERGAIINSSRHEDFQSQNGSSSESRDVNAIYDHHSCHNPLDGNNEKLEKNDYDASRVLSALDEDKSLGKGIERIQGNKETIHELGFDGNGGGVEVEKELTSAKNNSCQSINIEYIESKKKFDEREDQNSSGSSTEECSITDKKTKAYSSSYKTNVCNDKPDESSPAAATIVINESASIGECTNLSVDSTLVADSVKSEIPMSTGKLCLYKVADGGNLVVSDTVTSGLKEDANTLLSSQCNGIRASSLTNLGSPPKENNDKVLDVSMENDQISSSMMEQGSKYLEGKRFLSSVSPAVGASKDDPITKDSEIPICSNKQNSAPAPTMAQRTSIFSCCGLLDLLKGSN